MSDDPRGLVPLDQLRQWLAQAASIDEVREVRDQAEAIRLYRKNAGHGEAMQNHAAEIKIRSERRIGELLAEMPRNPGGPVRSQAATPPPRKLKELGFTKSDSSRYQQMARVPEPDFEQHLAEEKAKEHAELTSAKVLEKAKELQREERRRAREEREAAQRARPAPGNLVDVELACAPTDALPQEENVVQLIVTSPPYGLDKPYHRKHDDDEGYARVACATCGYLEEGWVHRPDAGWAPCPGGCGGRATVTVAARVEERGDVPANGWFDWMVDALKEWLRVTVVGGRLALNVPLDTTKGGYRPTYAQAVLAAEIAGWEYRSTIVWHDTQLGKSTARGSVDSYTGPSIIAPVEMIALFSKGEWIQAPRGESDLTREEWLAWTNGLWEFPGESHPWEGHPAAFPEELPHRLIKLLSAPGDTVLDPCVGSGTTVVVAHRLGRKAIGYDVSEAYLASTRRRLAASLGEGPP